MQGADASPEAFEVPWRGLMLVGIMGAVVRLSVFFGTLSDVAFGLYRTDEAYYHELAARWASGELGAPEGALSMSPLWTGLLAAIYTVIGDATAWPLLINQLMGIGATLMIFTLSRRVMDPRWAAAAAILYTLLGPVLFYESLLTPDTLVTFTLLGATNSLLLWNTSPTPRRAVFTGLWIGLASLARPSALLLVVGIGLASLLWLLRRTPPEARHRGRTGLLIALTATLTIAPVTARNHVTGGDTVLVTTGGPLNLYLGNGPDADGTYRFPTGWPRSTGTASLFDAATLAAQTETRTSLTAPRVRAHWRNATLAHVRQHPTTWLRVELRKVRFTLMNRERPNMYDYAFERLYRAPLDLPLFIGAGWVVGPGLLGLGLLFKRREALWPLLVVPGTLVTTLLLFFVLGRYRVALLPFSALGSVVLLRASVIAWHTQRWRDLGLMVAGTGALLLVAFGPETPRPDGSWPTRSEHHQRALDLVNADRCEAAAPELWAAAQEDTLPNRTLQQVFDMSMHCGNIPLAVNVLDIMLPRAYADDPSFVPELQARREGLLRLLSQRDTPQ